MSKRRRGINRVHHQVPSLRYLAANQVRRNDPHWRHNTRSSSHFIHRMDTNMSGAGHDAGTQTINTGTAAQQGANEAGKGLAVTVPRNIPHIWNNNYTVRLTYADNYRHVFNYGSAASQVFRTNSIFDPDFTGTGHQPLGRDLWASMYDYYCVLACHYQIKLYNGAVWTLTTTESGNLSNRHGAANVTLLPSTNSVDVFGSGDSISPHAEMKNAQTQFLEPEGVIEFSGTLTPGDFIVDAKDSDSDTTWTAVGSNPAVPRYLGYILTSAQWASITGQNETPFIVCYAQVILNFDVQFTQINQSLRSVGS